MKKRLAVFTGAGVSVESGISTFRDSNGLWCNHRVEDVASPEGWQNNKQLVLDFYNARRQQLFTVQPNRAHQLIVALEQYFDVFVITQNVDDLHERAGSSQVIHLHGELRKARSEANEHLIYPWEGDILIGDKAMDGCQLRPHIVWFGEVVPMMEVAYDIVKEADIFLVIGTSLQVYPAAGILHAVPADCSIYLIDPYPPSVHLSNVTAIQDTACKGMETFYKIVCGDI